jgi:hypothetical protein
MFNYERFKALYVIPFNSEDNFYNRVLFAQAFHETGNFTSRIFREAKNMFGMRPAQSREKFYIDTLTTSNGVFASYSGFFDSIRDRMDLDDYNDLNTDLRNKDDVLQYMMQVQAKGYAIETDYVDAWLNVYNNLFENKPYGPQEDTYGNYGEDGNSWTSDLDSDSSTSKLKKYLPYIAILGVAIYGYFKARKMKLFKTT